jgi:hypothetical protein
MKKAYLWLAVYLGIVIFLDVTVFKYNDLNKIWYFLPAIVVAISAIVCLIVGFFMNKKNHRIRMAQINVVQNISIRINDLMSKEQIEESEATYLSICSTLDYYLSNGMKLEYQTITTDLLVNELKEFQADVMIYLAWRYGGASGLTFKPEVIEALKARHKY